MNGAVLASMPSKAMPGAASDAHSIGFLASASSFLSHGRASDRTEAPPAMSTMATVRLFGSRPHA